MAKFAAKGNMTLTTVYISTGSNIGDRSSHLLLAKKALDIRVGALVKSSSIYETEAWGKTDQPSFLNQVHELQTEFDPESLLKMLHEIESDLGRERLEKWGPRIIDIDILFYSDIVLNLETLIIPHPQIVNRKFILEPLNEIAPAHIHPIENQSIAYLLDNCRDLLTVRPFP